MYQLVSTFQDIDRLLMIARGMRNRYGRNTCRPSSVSARPYNSFHSQTVWEFRDSVDVLRILPFVVRHAQRRAHNKSAADSRIPERECGSERNVKSESNHAESIADQPFPLMSHTGCRVNKQLSCEKYRIDEFCAFFLLIIVWFYRKIWIFSLQFTQIFSRKRYFYREIFASDSLIGTLKESITAR